MRTSDSYSFFPTVNSLNDDQISKTSLFNETRFPGMCQREVAPGTQYMHTAKVQTRYGRSAERTVMWQHVGRLTSVLHCLMFVFFFV